MSFHLPLMRGCHSGWGGVQCLQLTCQLEEWKKHDREQKDSKPKPYCFQVIPLSWHDSEHPTSAPKRRLRFGPIGAMQGAV